MTVCCGVLRRRGRLGCVRAAWIAACLRARIKLAHAPPVRVEIRSGDILIGEFGLMPHAVSVPADEAPPRWWGEVDHFGTKRRCNVLFRQALTEKQQLGLANARAKKVYGMSLKELRAKTGKDDAFLAVHLRHAALE